MVEKNQGASSDYNLSSQITDFLVPETILKLAVVKYAPPIKTEDELPQLAKVARDIWEGIKEHKILVPKEIEAGITARSKFGLIEVKVKTQLLEGDAALEGQFQLIPIWLTVAFDPAHPGSLAYARLRGAVFGASGEWKGGAASARGFDGEVIIGLDGTTRNRVSEITFFGGEMHQYLDITRDGSAQLFVRGVANLSISSDSIMTLNLTDDKNAVAVGEVGVRLMKQLLIRGRVQLNAFQALYENKDEDMALEGFAPSLGAGVDWQLKKNMKIHGDVLRMDTSGLENNGGAKSVTGAMFGVQIKFW